MKMSQRSSLCGHLKQAKMSFFSFFYKIGEQEGGPGPAQWGRVRLVPVGEGKRWGGGIMWCTCMWVEGRCLLEVFQE
jgi:hypothetical protein